MRKRDYSEHHSHASVTHEVIIKKPKKIRPFFLKPFFLILFFLVLLFSFAVFSPVFAVKKITIVGTNSTQLINQVELIARNFLNRQKVAGFFVLAEGNLRKELNDPEKIETIKINRKFPNTLMIEITPKIPAFVWQEGDNYFLIDNNGMVLTPIILSQNEWNLPLVTGATTTVFNLQDKLVKLEMVNFIKEFNKKINKANINLSLAHYIIPDLAGREVRALTKDSWEIIFMIENTTDKLIENLKYLLATKFKDQKPKEYLDLRLEDRIFYK